MNAFIKWTSSIILVLLFSCSPKLPLHNTSGDLANLKMRDGRRLKVELLDADQDQLFVQIEENTLYKIDLNQVKSLKVKGYNDTEVSVYFVSSVILTGLGVALISDEVAGSESIAITVTGVLSGVGAIFSLSKNKYKPPLQMKDMSKLRLHLRYPQGLNQEQQRELLLSNNQRDFLLLETANTLKRK